MDTIDWRAQLQPVIRQRKANEIMSKLAKHHHVPDDNELLEVRKIAQSFEHKTYACAISQVDYLQKISFMISLFEAKRQEEVYQKIKILKEAYLSELTEMYQKISAKLQQHDSLPQQPTSEKLEKLKMFKTMLERIISFLQAQESHVFSAARTASPTLRALLVLRVTNSTYEKWFNCSYFIHLFKDFSHKL